MRKLVLIGICISILSYFGCAGFKPATKTNELKVGMSRSEVQEVLGTPTSTQIISDKLVVKYDLYENVKGMMPYYLVYDKRGERLEKWYADEEEYYRQQQLWIQKQPKKQEVDYDITIRKN